MRRHGRSVSSSPGKLELRLDLCDVNLLVGASLAAVHALDSVRVNDRLAEVTRSDLLLKQRIQFAVGTTLRLWQTEPSPNQAQEACSGEEEARLCALRTMLVEDLGQEETTTYPVPCCWVQHSWRQDIADNATDVVPVPCKHHCLLS